MLALEVKIMARTIIFENVKKEFEERGFTLLSEEYIDNKTKMQFYCNKHKEIKFNICYGNFKRWGGCSRCNESKCIKPTFEEIKQVFEELGYTLISENYINAETKLKFYCNKHKDIELNINYSHFKQGRGCKRCNGNKCISPTFEEVKLAFEERGYELLETEYKDSQTKIHYRCSLHAEKILTIRMHDFNQGCGCPYCKKCGKPSFEEVKKAFADRNYELLETEYIRANVKMRYRCNIHFEQHLSIRWNNFKQGQGCPLCYSDKNHGENCYKWKGGITPLTSYLRGESTKEWRKKTLKQNNYKCFITGKVGGKLIVHHLQSFYKIRDEALAQLNIIIKKTISEYKIEDLAMMIAKISELHEKEKGVVLVEPVHKLFHHLYGMKNTTPEDFYEFAERWRSGEFENSAI